MKSIQNQYRDLKEGKMSEANFMRNLRMSLPQYVTNVTSFGDAVKILKNKSILTENTKPEDQPSEEELDVMIKKMEDEKAGEEAVMSQYDEELNEAVGNFELKKLARELYSVIKRVNGVTGVKIVTSDIKNAASAFQATSKKGNTYAEDAVMAEIFVNEAASFISVILSGTSRVLNPVANEVNKQLQAFVGKNYADQLDAQYVKAPNDNTMLGINIKFKVNPAGVKESEELNEAKKKEEKIEYSEHSCNPTELRLGIRTELEKDGVDELDKAKKIAIKNIHSDPTYYTKLKLSGVDALPKVKDKAPVKKAKKETTQLVDLVNGMQKVKMPKADEKKKLKEGVDEAMPFADLPADSNKYKIVRDSKGYIIKATNADGVEFQKGDEATTYDGEKIKIAKFEESQGKVKAIYSTGMFFRGIDIDGLEAPKATFRPGVNMGASFEKMKKSLEEIVREVVAETFDGRDNLIDPIAAEENN
jgi:hypothetical protein